MPKRKLVYFVEPQTRRDITRFYVWYLQPGAPVQTLFDICESQEKADEAIELHKQGKHTTQWTPNQPTQA